MLYLFVSCQASRQFVDIDGTSFVHEMNGTISEYSDCYSRDVRYGFSIVGTELCKSLSCSWILLRSGTKTQYVCSSTLYSFC